MGPGGADETAPSSDDVRMPASPARARAPVAVVSDGTSGDQGSDPAARATLDADSRHWVEQLRARHPRYQSTVARLHGMLRRVASYELSRRRRQLRSIGGPEFDDLAQQAADDALINILDRLDEFRGLSRFTTWAYKFVMFEVSAKVSRHAWVRQPPDAEEIAWDRLPDPAATRPEDWLERRAQLDALSQEIGELTDRQREVFVAVALNDVPIDVVALKLGTNRNAVYKNLFDARRRLRAGMAAAGHPVGDGSAREIAAGGDARLGRPAGGSPR
jgi:RNA polymerase sigma-70 factor, ECF subfamily